MDQGQQAPQAPQAQPAAAAVPPAQPPPPPAPPAAPVPPAPPVFALGPGRSHAVLDYDDPNTGATATKLYNKAISPLEEKFDGDADNLAVFLASVRDRARRFNWHRLITVPIDDGTTRNILTHYGQVSLENTRAHATTYVNTPTRDAQDNDMFYYFLADSLTNEFRATVLLYSEVYTVTNVPVTDIKDLKSQCDDGRATFTAEDLMVCAENKYEARLLDEENAWGKPTEEQEKIVAMSAEINSLKKERSTATSKASKPKEKAKKQAPKKAASKKPADNNKKKKSNDKWAWKNKPPKDSDPKENDAYVKNFESKKYFWCKNHNNGAGMWTLHHPTECESGTGNDRATTNANLATFDTMDSDSE